MQVKGGRHVGLMGLAVLDERYVGELEDGGGRWG
jgi:hypothetical protein